MARLILALGFLWVCEVAGQELTAKRHLVVAANPLAAEAGAAVLRAGGSAVDAAIAVQAVLGLVEPQSSGIGGGAFMLHWSANDRSVRAYDGRETAPATATPARFLNSNAKPMDFSDAAVSGRSVGVPGVLRMLELAHRRHGKLAWAELFSGAIFLAEEGFAISPRLHGWLSRERFLAQDPAARALYFEEGRPKAAGTRLVNRDYGATLRAIAAGGADAFYRGPIADAMVRAVAAHARPGDLSIKDLAGYRALERQPVCAPYRAWRVCSMPPPSSGGVAVLQMLGLLERTPFAGTRPHSLEAAHYFAEAGRIAYQDRARYLGDPDFSAIPVERLLSRGYLDEKAGIIRERGRRTRFLGQAEAPGTSHFVIVDAQGDVVSMTSSIEAPFGSRIQVRGFLLNNQLTDFDFAPGGPNEARGGKRPRSSMAPTIVFDRAGAPQLAVGSAGGSFIINYVAKALVAALDWNAGIQAAVAGPNFGSRSGPVEIELGTSYEPLAARLGALGHEVAIRDMESGLHGIERVTEGSTSGWRGGADPRREGAARGD